MGRPKGSKNIAIKEVLSEEVELPVGNGKPDVTEIDKNAIIIEDLETVKMIVEAEIAEKKLNPSYLAEGEIGTNFIKGEPHVVIDNQYVPYDEAQIILQTRKVVREWIKLENLKKGIKE